MLVVCGALGIIDCLILCGADGLAVALTLLLCNCLVLGCALLVQGIPKLEISLGLYPMGGHPKAPCGKLVNDFLIFLSWHKCNSISLYEMGFFSAPIQYMYIHISRKLCMKILSCNTVKRYIAKGTTNFFLETNYYKYSIWLPGLQHTKECTRDRKLSQNVSLCFFYLFVYGFTSMLFFLYIIIFVFVENYCVPQVLL